MKILLTTKEIRAAKKSVNRSIWGARDEAIAKDQALKIGMWLRERDANERSTGTYQAFLKQLKEEQEGKQ